MNTGTQRSGATPRGVRTATTPIFGKQQRAKDILAIMEAHHLSYIATACPAYPGDLYDKVRKAKDKPGTRYIHITAPCPPGWVFPTCDTITKWDGWPWKAVWWYCWRSKMGHSI